MIRNKKRAFSMVEILVVIVLISAGILPIYTLMRSGQKRIVRADSRTIATLFGASALELARTLGYDKAQKLHKDDDFMQLQHIAVKNGYEIGFEPVFQPVSPLPEGAKPLNLLRIKVTVASKHRTSTSDVPVLTFVGILTDPRYNFY
mgnify:CR=1 FL=1